MTVAGLHLTTLPIACLGHIATDTDTLSIATVTKSNSAKVLLATRVSFAKVEFRTAILAAVEAISGTDQQVSISGAAMAQIEALSLAESATVDVFDVVFDGACDGHLLGSGGAVASFGVVVVRDA